MTGGGRKVRVPDDGPGVVARRRLEDRLDGAADRRLTLVTAGPGLGKTTLLAAWARRRACAWYTVGVEDRDPAVLARGLLEAARQRVPDLDPGAVTPPGTTEGWTLPNEGRGSLAADELVNMLAGGLAADLTLVLDDVHEVRASDPSSQLLADLVRTGPFRLHLVLAGRADPPFGVARLGATGRASRWSAPSASPGGCSTCSSRTCPT